MKKHYSLFLCLSLLVLFLSNSAFTTATTSLQPLGGPCGDCHLLSPTNTDYLATASSYHLEDQYFTETVQGFIYDNTRYEAEEKNLDLDKLKAFLARH